MSDLEQQFVFTVDTGKDFDDTALHRYLKRLYDFTVYSGTLTVEPGKRAAFIREMVDEVGLEWSNVEALIKIPLARNSEHGDYVAYVGAVALDNDRVEVTALNTVLTISNIKIIPVQGSLVAAAGFNLHDNKLEIAVMKVVN